AAAGTAVGSAVGSAAAEAAASEDPVAASAAGAAGAAGASAEVAASETTSIASAPDRTADRGRRPHRTTRRSTTMTQKSSILGRVSQLAKANINALLDRAEDPEK